MGRPVLVDLSSMGHMGLIPDPGFTCEVLARALQRIKRCEGPGVSGCLQCVLLVGCCPPILTCMPWTETGQCAYLHPTLSEHACSDLQQCRHPMPHPC